MPHFLQTLIVQTKMHSFGVAVYEPVVAVVVVVVVVVVRVCLFAFIVIASPYWTKQWT